MLNFKTVCPNIWKQDLILCHLNIAKRLYPTYDLFNDEVSKIKSMFHQNKYPDSFFEKVLNKFLNS